MESLCTNGVCLAFYDLEHDFMFCERGALREPAAAVILLYDMYYMTVYYV